MIKPDLMAKFMKFLETQSEYGPKLRELTIDGLYLLTKKEHWSRARFNTSAWKKEAERYYKKFIKRKFGKQLISEVTAKEIRRWHQGYEHKPYAANRALEVLSKMFNMAEEMELRPQGTNPCTLVKAFPERSRTRFASLEEIKKIGQILFRESKANPKATAFLYLLMFCGARPSAIEQAKWSQLRLVEDQGKTSGILTFNGKTTRETGQQEVVILPPQAMEIINRIPKTSEKIIGIKMPRRQWHKIRIEAGCPDLWARDLRRTFSTIALSNGVDGAVIGELLNHRSAQTTKIYAKLHEQERLKAASKIADKIHETINEGETA